MSRQQESFQEQLERYYQGMMSSIEIISLGETPQPLIELGAEKVPLVMKQSTLNKCIREKRGSRSAHHLERTLIEKLPNIVKEPVLIVEEKDRNSFALLSDVQDKDGNNLLIAIRIGGNLYGKKVNEVKSVYGKENLKSYLQKHEQQDIHVIDTEKAKQLPLNIGLQLPQPPIALDYNKNITDFEQHVNPQNEKSTRASPEIVKDIRKSGFQATKSLIKNIRQLDALNGRANSMRDICSAYKNGCTGMNQEQKDLVEKIAKECREQELARMQLPER